MSGRKKDAKQRNVKHCQMQSEVAKLRNDLATTQKELSEMHKQMDAMRLNIETLAKLGTKLAAVQSLVSAALEEQHS